MRTISCTVACMLVIGQSAFAQGPGMRRQDLQRQVVQRFMQGVRVQAGLDDEQFQRFEQVTRNSFDERAAIAFREQALWRELEGQMRPGVAADPDSVQAILDGLVDQQAARVELARTELETFRSFLDPVQHAQVMLAWRRLQLQIDRILQGRRDRPMDVP